MIILPLSGYTDLVDFAPFVLWFPFSDFLEFSRVLVFISREKKEEGRPPMNIPRSALHSKRSLREGPLFIFGHKRPRKFNFESWGQTGRTGVPLFSTLTFFPNFRFPRYVQLTQVPVVWRREKKNNLRRLAQRDILEILAFGRKIKIFIQLESIDCLCQSRGRNVWFWLISQSGFWWDYPPIFLFFGMKKNS